MNAGLFTAITACTAIAMASSGYAQSNFEVLRQLAEPEYPPVGKLFEGTGGRLYGVVAGSPYWSKGAVMAYDRQPNGALTATVLHAFTGPDGALPFAGVIQGSDGALYGTTFTGGAENRGTIFRIAPDGAFTALHHFSAALGGYSRTELLEADDGHLYGSFSFFDSGVLGGIFRITKAGVFSVVAEGPGSRVALIDGHDGRFYGITTDVAVDPGTVFSVTHDGVYTVLRQFSRPGPIMPLSLIDGRDGFLYGTTFDAFDDSRSTIFRISRTGAFNVLHTNDAPRTSAISFENLIRASDGNFYGTTGETIYRVTPSGSFSILHRFQFSFGSGANSLMQTADGSLFGSTADGGFARRGTIFRATTSGEHRVAYFFPGADPLQVSTLLAGPDGAIYGSSCGGGTLNAGTIFKLTDDARVLTVLHSFAYWDGMCPSGPMAFGADGALYGTAGRYGLGGGGTIFRLTTTGTFGVVRYFTGGPDGAWPTGLIRASDGNFYGTTEFNGASGAGTIYRLGSSGFATLHALVRTRSFVRNPAIMQGPDGHLYGVAPWRPFRMTLAGVLTYFSEVPALVWPLEAGPDGNLYGTTVYDLTLSPAPPATLFRMTPDGAATVLHTFPRVTDDDRDPCYGLIAAPGGTLYGRRCSNRNGDVSGDLFAFTGAGAPVTIHTFDPVVGSAPTAALMVGADGALYGATSFGGPTYRGGIYRLKRP